MKVIFNEEKNYDLVEWKKNTGTAENRRQENRRTLPIKITKVVHVSRKIK